MLISLVDAWVGPGLAALLGWSLRWGALILVLAAWLRLRPPTRAATRHRLVGAVLVAGLLLPLAPGWALPAFRWPRPVIAESPGRAEIATPAPPASPLPRVDPPARPIEVTARPAAPPVVGGAGRSRPIPQTPGDVAVGTASPLGSARAGLLVLAGAWLVGATFGLGRVACGGLVLVRLRRSSRPVAGAGRVGWDDARADGGLARRAVGLATHPGVGSPVVLGGRRALVLVPAGWDAWPEAERRACLLHELAHLARGDDRWKLLAELARVPFWFHPGVAWLASRLDREAELACDEAAVARGVPPRDLARLLLAQARAPRRLDPRAGALAFFDRATVPTRIARLLEDDMPRTAPRPAPLQVAGLAAVAALALAIGGARVRAIEPPPPPPPPRFAPPIPPPQDRPPVAGSFRVEVKDEAGQPVAGAMVAAGIINNVDETVRDVSFAEADANGLARFDREPRAGIWVVGFKGGLSFSARNLFDPTGRLPTPLVLPLGQVLGGTVVDAVGRPIAGAEVVVAGAEVGRGRAPHLAPILVGVARGTPIEPALVARTGADGRFRFDWVPAGSVIGLVASAPGKAIANASATSAAAGAKGVSDDSVRIVLPPEAKVVGRVVSRVPGVEIGGRTVRLWGINEGRSSSIRGRATTDDAGRFAIGGLPGGRANVLLDGVAPAGPWTFVGAAGVSFAPGATADATVEIVAGCLVTGTVAATDGTPLAGARVVAYGAGNPRSGAPPLSARTDAAGAYRFRLPPGAASVTLNGAVPGHAVVGANGASVEAAIPAGVATFALPPILLAREAPLQGRIVDAAGVPLPGARVMSVTAAGQYRAQADHPVAVADADGRFRVAGQASGRAIPAGEAVAIEVRLDDGREFDVEVVPGRGDGPATIRLPAFAAGGPAGAGEVAGDEIAGTVVDRQGRPIEGAVADAYSWAPGNRATTDAAGRFRIRVPEQGKLEVRVTRDGYEPREYLRQPTGQPGWVVVLDDRTYFEGRVLAPDGSPVADAPIRVDSGRKRMDGGIMTHCYTDGKAGPDGRYRLLVEPGLYEFQLRVPGHGVLRLGKQAIGANEAVPLDLKLIPGVNFEARFVNSTTGAPVAGYRLEDWRNPSIAATSDANGVARIAEMLPGPFEFSKPRDGDDYARWWSDACTTEYGRFEAANRFGFQRNFDGLDFDLRPGMAPVTIALEPAATIRGVVLDPDGRPVAGATVAPALTGSGNSLSGDTRFSVETGTDGTYTMKLPASGKIAYNLVAHDGKYGETRAWANGVIDPFRTTPGQVLDGVTLRLTRGATVAGRVVDAATGVPIAGREVRASAADKRENRYYDPTTTTQADGTFVLTNIRPGEQFIQAAPFWLDAAQAPAGTTLTATLAPGEAVAGVELKASLRGR